MNRLRTRLSRLLLLLPAAAGLATLVVMAGGSPPDARAYPGLTAGLDIDTSSTTDTNNDGAYETVDVGTFENCIGKSNGNFFSVDVFVLDVANLNAFSVDLEYDENIIDVTSVNVNRLLSTAGSGTVQDASGGDEPGPGRYNVQAFIDSNPLAGVSGSGILARLSLTAIGQGVSPFNIEISTQYLRGVVLVDNGNPPVDMGDTNADSLFDGPFINATGVIAVNAPDSDFDGDPDACDNDMDNDGWVNAADNCPTIYNPTQSDIDGDNIGDVCDGYDADGDGYPNTFETTHGSDPMDPASRPEVCDGTDNDLNSGVDEGYDYDGTGGPDCTQVGKDTDSDGIPNTSDLDDDGDGWTDADEAIIASDSLKRCNNGAGLPDWPPDFNDSRHISILDITQMTPPVFGSTLGSDDYSRRKDLAGGNGVINILDIITITPPVFGTVLALATPVTPVPPICL